MTTVFGNPGSTEILFLQDWPIDFDYVLALQEASVVAMADGFAQTTGNAAFVNLHSAAGLGNALGAVFTAYRNQTPLVITAGQQSRTLLMKEPYLYAERAAEFPRPYVKWSIEPARAADVPVAIARAYHTSMQKPCGPTFVSIPGDDWNLPAAEVPDRQKAYRTAPDSEFLRELAAAIVSSEYPAFVVGSEVDRDGAFDLMVELAETVGGSVWEAPVANRASFPENHDLFCGFLPATPSGLAAALAPYDLIVVLGAPAFTYHVAEHSTDVLANKLVFHVSANPAAVSWSPFRACVGCPGLVIQGLIAELRGCKLRGITRGATRRRIDGAAATEPISPAFVMRTLAKLRRDDAIIVEEAPSHRVARQAHLPVLKAGGFLTMASGGLGYGLPAAVGVALASGLRRVICIIGDGSAMYSVQALWTAAQRALPVSVIVLNNRGYGAMRAFRRRFGLAAIPGTELPGLDFVKLALGHGCQAFRVRSATELPPVLARALASNGPVLVDVWVDPDLGDLY